MDTDFINGKGLYQINDDRCQETWLSNVNITKKETKFQINIIIPNWYKVSSEPTGAWDMGK